jgi:hypothetical protein
VEELDFSWKYKMIQPCDDKSMPPHPRCLPSNLRKL